MSETPVIQKKICLLGSFAVGKTSLVERFVSGNFSEKYLTTVGVRITKRSVPLEDRTCNLVIWDLHGEDSFQKVLPSYLRGSSGYLLVVDGTRPETLQTAIELHRRAQSVVGQVPFLLLLNKSDLVEEWGLDEAKLEPVSDWTTLQTSAKTNAGVEMAFELLSRRMSES